MRILFSKTALAAVFFPILAATLFTSCATLPLSTLMPQGKNERLLPPLTPVIDIQSFGSVFRNKGELNDISTIFSRDIENISVPIYSVKTKGTIIARVASGKNKRFHIWPQVLSGVCTAFFINLLGVPYDYTTANLQIEVTILNDKDTVVGKYVSNYHEQTSSYAMYWGYSFADAPKRNVRLVFAECMKDIKHQIANDYDRLNEALNYGQND
ncbi:MAG: hypothetical protein FWF63_11070 [Fibromonadales bacterium]|nr:hypothetical protein [Fibromonadales bacterium]